MNRPGLRNSRTCVASVTAMRAPSTGVASTHRRDRMPMLFSWNSTKENPSPWTWVTAETSATMSNRPSTLRVALKSKQLFR